MNVRENTQFVEKLKKDPSVILEDDSSPFRGAMSGAVVSLPQALSRQLSQGHKCAVVSLPQSAIADSSLIRGSHKGAVAKSKIWTLTYLSEEAWS